METPPICNYEGSDYRTRFWEGQGRDYEDLAERVALRALMPASGSTLLDIGAGYGRLAGEYAGYRTVVLFDYSRSLLRQAQARLGHDPRFLFVAGNWYRLPFVNGLFQTLVQVRTIHHAADVPALFAALSRVAQPGAAYVLEFANKQNLKAIARFCLRRQPWSPFAPEPVEFANLNFDFHPRWMRQQLLQAGFRPRQQRTVSHFRLPLLKKTLPTRLLVALDSLVQPTGKWWQLSPSVFLLCRHEKEGAAAPPGSFFACPACAAPLPDPENGRIACSCGRQWCVEGNFYDFKEPCP